MLSKEEIEKAKERLKKEIENSSYIRDLAKISNSAKEIMLRDNAIETLLQYIDQLEQENKKQNKMIDEMVDCIWNYDICDYEITDYTYRKCEYIADDEEKPCKQCIKQYFEKKVEEEL